METSIISQLTNASKSPLALTAYIVLLIVWLLYSYKKYKTKEFISILETTPKSKIDEVLKRTGYKHSDLAQLGPKERYKYLMKRYLFIGYISTIIFVLLLVLSFLFYSNPDETGSLIKQGDAQYQKGNIDEAKDLFTQALSHNENSIEAITGKIKTEIRLREYEKAQETILLGFKVLHSKNISGIHKAKLLKYRGLLKKHNQEYESAETDFKNGIDEIKNCDSYECIQTLAALNGNLANLYARQGEFKLTHKYLKLALKHDRVINDEKGELADLANLAAIYEMEGKKDSAIIVAKQSLEIAKRLNDIRNIIYTYWHLATINETIDHNQAEAYYNLALEYFSSNNFEDRRLESRILGDFGAFLLNERKNLDLAEKKLIASLNINIEISDKSSLSSQCSNLYKISRSKNYTESAIAYGLIAIEFMIDVNEEQKQTFIADFTTFSKSVSLERPLDYHYLCFLLEKASGIGISKWKKIINPSIRLTYSS